MAKRENEADKSASVLVQLANQSQIDFEIGFFDSILRNNPEFVPALRAQAHSLTAKGRYSEGLQLDRRLAKLRPNDPLVHYNLACSYSLLELLEPSLKALDAAIRLGYDDLEHIFDDDDLKNVRADERFLDLLSTHWQRHVVEEQLS